MDKENVILGATNLVKSISQKFGIDILSKTRKTEYIIVRQPLMYLFYDEINTLSFPDVGRIFGKNHATVIHATKQVKNAFTMTDGISTLMCSNYIKMRPYVLKFASLIGQLQHEERECIFSQSNIESAMESGGRYNEMLIKLKNVTEENKLLREEISTLREIGGITKEDREIFRMKGEMGNAKYAKATWASV